LSEENVTKTISENNNIINSINNNYSKNDYFFEDNSRLKFSNKEKNLLKKRLYDKALQDNSELNNCDNYPDSPDSSQIFLKQKKVDKK